MMKLPITSCFRIAVAFWIIQIVSVQECSSLKQNLMHIGSSTHSVFWMWQPHSTRAQSTRLPPHWLVQWSCHRSHMCLVVHSPWLPGYLNVVQTILIILTMASLFLDRPHTYILLNKNTCLFFRDPSHYFTIRENFSVTAPLWLSAIQKWFLKLWVFPTASTFPRNKLKILRIRISSPSLVSHITLCTYNTSGLSYWRLAPRPCSPTAQPLQSFPLWEWPPAPLSDRLTQRPVYFYTLSLCHGAFQIACAQLILFWINEWMNEPSSLTSGNTSSGKPSHPLPNVPRTSHVLLCSLYLCIFVLLNTLSPCRSKLT